MNIALIALSRPLSLLSPSSLSLSFSLSRIPHHQLSGLYSPLLPPSHHHQLPAIFPPPSLPSFFLRMLAEVTNLQEGMVWHGMAWHGMAWHGVAWRGVAWRRRWWPDQEKSGVEWWGVLLSICLTTTIRGRKTEIWGWRGLHRGWGSRGLWDRDGGWRGRGVGVNIVMISPEFRSSGPMRRKRDTERKGGRERERAAAVLSPQP